jgi:hypothetical protein
MASQELLDAAYDLAFDRKSQYHMNCDFLQDQPFTKLQQFHVKVVQTSVIGRRIVTPHQDLYFPVFDYNSPLGTHISIIFEDTFFDSSCYTTEFFEHLLDEIVDQFKAAHPYNDDHGVYVTYTTSVSKVE